MKLKYFVIPSYFTPKVIPAFQRFVIFLHNFILDFKSYSAEFVT